VFLARNNDLANVVTSVKQMEDRFNKRYNYPYVFLNDKAFDEKFMACVARRCRARDGLMRRTGGSAT
jgi:alpha 1,2-mannosyltransferase